ncbi:MAG TPA: DNA double-strand break repair nuclease NurA [Anaerolineales bacterium]|nr:DNA double-strand break repair nuclease NurA [Anaerolineales bacterium]
MAGDSPSTRSRSRTCRRTSARSRRRRCTSARSWTRLLHFFYLNVGTLGHPWPVRVEVPQWVAEDKKKLELLHSVLIEQCDIMGSKPYPYLLHRAHETAVVRREEKDQIEQLLAMELRRVRAEIGDRSHKDSAKSLPGRSRVKR